MPLNQCTKDGKSGWRWGNQTCYTGPGAKKKAAKQGAAIEIQKHKTKANLSEFLDLSSTELFEILTENDVAVGDKWACIKKFEEMKHGKQN